MIGEFKKTLLTGYVDVSSAALGYVDANGVKQGGLAVMYDAANGDNRVKLPTGTNVQAIAGITQWYVAQAADIRQISLCSDGDVYCIAAGAIAVGDRVYNYGTDGKVAKIPQGTTLTGSYNCIGEALTPSDQSGDRILIRLTLPTQQIEV